MLEDIILIEINPMQKNKCSMIPLTYEVPQIVKFIKTENRIVVISARDIGKRKLLFNWYRVSVWEDGNLLAVDSNDGCTKCKKIWNLKIQERKYKKNIPSPSAEE